MLEDINIVLVEPSHPGNIGAVARSMKNMGFCKLSLVNPKDFPSKDAFVRASHATDVVNDAAICPDLSSAIGDHNLLFATSARSRNQQLPLVTPAEVAKICKQQAKGSKIAILFGRENTGLHNDEINQCQYHIHIPTNPEYSSLNLAMAVQLITYELRLKLVEEDSPEEFNPNKIPLAKNQDMQSFYQHLEQICWEIGFFDDNNVRPLMPKLKRIFQKAQMNEREVKILRGILSSIASFRR